MRVADLEQTVEKLTAEIQLMRNQHTELLNANGNLFRIAAGSIKLTGMLMQPLNDQPAPGEPSQEGPSSSKKARRS